MISAVMAFLIGLFASAPAAAQTGTLSTHQIRVVYVQPTEARHQPIYEALQQRRVLETLAPS